MGTIDNIIVFKDQSTLTYIYDSNFPEHVRPNNYFHNNSRPSRAWCEVCETYVGWRGMKNTCIVFEHVKRLKDWTTMAYCVYNGKHCKLLIITYCDMLSRNDTTLTLFREILNVGIVEMECQT